MAKRRREFSALPGTADPNLSGDWMPPPQVGSSQFASVSDTRTARSLKRSITVRPDIDAAVRELVGDGAYSDFVNRALLMAIQARGIDAMVERFEAEHGPLTADDFAEADRRRAEAHRLADERARRS